MRAFFTVVVLGQTLFFATADRVDGPATMPVYTAIAPAVEVAPPPRRGWDYYPGFIAWVTALDRHSITVQRVISEMESYSDVRDDIAFEGRKRKNIFTSISGKPFILKRPGGPGAEMRAIRLEASSEVFI